MKTGEIELAFTVSGKELGGVTVMLGSDQLYRNYPVMTSLYLRIMFIVVLPFVWIAELRGGRDPAHPGGEGVHWGAQQMIAGPEDLTLQWAARATVYRWAAIRNLRKTRKMILLMLTSRHAILVPRRAFASRKDEKRFCNFVRDRIADAAKSSQESVSAGYRYT